MSTPSLHIVAEHTIVLKWQPAIAAETSLEIASISKSIKEHFATKIIELVPAYHELALYVKPDVSTYGLLQELNVFFIERNRKMLTITLGRVVTIPVCYEPPFALDIEEVADFHNITTKQLIEIHTAQTYTVSFLGFLPGFPYLTGLHEKLHMPRRTSPRPNITACSVGIGGKQTGVYPQDSPGGWHIIGSTPITLFNVIQQPPALLHAGDRIVFEAINSTAYQTIASKVKKEAYQLKIRHND